MKIKDFILNEKQLNDLYSYSWLQVAKYLINAKYKIWKRLGYKTFEDFLLAKNYLFSLEKCLNLIELYHILTSQLKEDDIEDLDIELLLTAIQYITRENFHIWLSNLDNETEFGILLDKFKRQMEINNTIFCIQQLNEITIQFNDLINSIQNIELKNVPDVNKKVFIKYFKENVQKLVIFYKKLKEQYDKEKI